MGIDRSIDHHSPSTRQGGSGTAGIGVRSDAQGQFFRFPIQWYASDPFSPIFSSNKPPVPGQQQRIFFFFSSFRFFHFPSHVRDRTFPALFSFLRTCDPRAPPLVSFSYPFQCASVYYLNIIVPLCSFPGHIPLESHAAWCKPFSTNHPSHFFFLLLLLLSFFFLLVKLPTLQFHKTLLGDIKVTGTLSDYCSEWLEQVKLSS